MWRNRNSFTAGGDSVQPFWKKFGSFIKRKICSYHMSQPFLSKVFILEMKQKLMATQDFMQMFIAALFVIAPKLETT